MEQLVGDESFEQFVQRIETDLERKSLDVEILTYFKVAHLKNEYLQEISLIFAKTAISIVESIPRNPERTVALRKLLESKDAAVRAAL